MKLSSMCWCGSSQVEIPVSWVSLGQTDSCSLNCGPGCEYAEPPDSDDPYDEPIVIAEEQRTWKMSKFNPAEYDPADDSTPGLPKRRDAVTILVDAGMCACGCGEAPAGTRTRFCMGHDARLKGALTRALASKVNIAVYAADGTNEVVSPTEYAARFSSAKTDWVTLIEDGAAKIAARRGVTDARAAEREVIARAARDGAIRVGKWGSTGYAAAIYHDPETGKHTVEYVDEVGRIQQVEVDVA